MFSLQVLLLRYYLILSLKSYPGVLERLKDEARLLGLMHHRAIVQVDGLTRLQGRWAVVMEYVEGVSLKELLSTGPLPLGPALLIGAEVSGALDAAWRRRGPSGQPLRLLHRDIKPSNIQITPNGDVKLLDFGVARADLDSREAETRRHLMGSLPYMAPERFELEDGPGGDMYALGISLCELLGADVKGRTRPRPEPHAQRVHQLMEQLPDLPASFAALLRRMLDYDPGQRPGARAFEREATQLFASIGGGLWLHDFAEDAVPPVLASRPVMQDVLTGTLLGEAEDDETAHTFLVPLPADAPRNGTFDEAPARRGAGVMAWLAGGGLLLVLGCLGAGCASIVGAWAFSESTLWQEQTAVEVDETLRNLHRRCDLLHENAERDQLEVQLAMALEDPKRRNIGLWEISHLEAEFDRVANDGYLSEAEMLGVLAVLQAAMRDW